MSISKSNKTTAPATSQPSVNPTEKSAQPKLPQQKKTTTKWKATATKLVAPPSASAVEPCVDNFVSTCQPPIKSGYVNLSQMFPNAIPSVLMGADVEVLCSAKFFESIEKRIAKVLGTDNRLCGIALHVRVVISEALLIIEPEYFRAGAKSIVYSGYINTLEEIGESSEPRFMFPYHVNLKKLRSSGNARSLIFSTFDQLADHEALSEKAIKLMVNAAMKYRTR